MKTLSPVRFPTIRLIASGLTLALAITPALGQKQNSKVPVPRFSLALRLISDTGDLDATSYLDDLQKAVKDKALASLPRTVSRGEEAIVIIRFEIQKDGTLATKVPPKFIFASMKKDLDDHAMSSISSAAPFHPLPEPISDRNLSVQLSFYYNMVPPPSQP